ncbi:MAG: adenosylmethionine--8-amino-7-oxononanoate transaminase [Yaniella sp.]|nr:adenosylmethionine--8-amino-7-oxononanoate transaminase [Yaniella sp.]
MFETDQATLLGRDRNLLWHPYGSLREGAKFAVTGASGPRVQLRGPLQSNDTTDTSIDVLDGMSSWWAKVHGYRHPEIDAALHTQIDAFSHVMFGGLTHEPAIELAERLVDITPPGLDHVFLADSGSVSIEVALKLALQYQLSHGRDRGKFLALRGAYHGDTTGAMAVCDPIGGMHSDFAPLLAENIFAPQPPLPDAPDTELDQWCLQMQNLVDQHATELAGIIVEPVLQGAGGMRTYDPRVLVMLRRLATEIDAIFIADEIATGFGRTGTAFACEQAGVVPDVMCVGKALTGGYLSMAALLCDSVVADVISESRFAALMHGPTVMANPLACAAANASLGLLFGDGESSWQSAVPRLSMGLQHGLAPAQDLPGVQDVNVTGAIGVITLNRAVDVELTTRIAAQAGVWLRPFRNNIYTMPPYICTPAQIAQITQAMVQATQAHQL